MAIPHKWRAAKLVNHRAGRKDSFASKFFDPFGARKSINMHFNLRNDEFNQRYDQGDYDHLGWRRNDD